MTVEEYIGSLDEPRRSEVEELHELILATLPQHDPSVDAGMIGYGRYQYRYASGRQGEAPVFALSSRKRYISLYVQCADEAGYVADGFRDRLPKADIGKSCVRFRRLGDVDLDVIRELLRVADQAGPAGAI